MFSINLTLLFPNFLHSYYFPNLLFIFYFFHFSSLSSFIPSHSHYTIYIYTMMIINRKISSQLTASSAYAFAGLSFGKKRDKPKNDSAKYDVVIVGGHLGALLSNHLDAVVGAKATIFVAYDNPLYQYPVVRSFYEKGLYFCSDVQIHQVRNAGHSQELAQQVRSQF